MWCISENVRNEGSAVSNVEREGMGFEHLLPETNTTQFGNAIINSVKVSEERRASAVVISRSVHFHASWEWAHALPHNKGHQRPCHYRYFSRPSITVARQRWGMLRWVWLKPRIPPILVQRKWEGRQAWSPCSMRLPAALFMCYLVHWLLLHVPSPLLEFCTGCRRIELVSLYVSQYLALTALCVQMIVPGRLSPTIYSHNLTFQIRNKNKMSHSMYSFSSKETKALLLKLLLVLLMLLNMRAGIHEW